VRLDAFLDVSGEIVIHGGVRCARPQILDDFRDYAAYRFRWFNDGHSAVTPFDYDLAALPDFGQHTDNILHDIGF
jgi:hypothetical protein